MDGTLTFPSTSSFKVPWLTIIIIVCIILCTHALIKHGANAEAVKNCYENQGPVETWKNPMTGRTASVCQLDTLKWGVIVFEGDNVVTAFIKDKMKTLSQVRTYLSNTGFTPPTP